MKREYRLYINGAGHYADVTDEDQAYRRFVEKTRLIIAEETDLFLRSIEGATDGSCLGNLGSIDRGANGVQHMARKKHSVDDDMRDFFISYSRTDRAWAEWLAWTLESEGSIVWLQDWDFRGNFINQMNKAHISSKHTVAILSPEYMSSEFTTA